MLPIPSRRLGVPLSLTFSCKGRWVIDTMKEFVENFYSFEYSNIHSTDDTNDNDDEKNNDYQTITPKTEDEEEDLEINKILDIPIVIDDE